jgi:hypothetical protein
MTSPPGDYKEPGEVMQGKGGEQETRNRKSSN